MDDLKLVLVCSDSLEGILTAVYDGWIYAGKGKMVEIYTEMPDNMELFCTYEELKTDPEKAKKVLRSVRRKLGEEVYQAVCYAAASNHPGKGTAVFYMLRQALAGGRCNVRIMEALADPYVNLVAGLRTKVGHEFHRFLGFVRFREVGGGVLFSKIAPENNILEMLAPHFENRYPNESWMIYDERRNKVLLHKKGEKCVLHTDVVLSEEYRNVLANTEEYEELWKAFVKSITIEERRNKRLQQQLVPNKFRPNMLEFQE